MISEKKKAYLKKYRQDNKEHIAEVAKRKYWRNRDKILEYAKKAGKAWDKKTGYAKDKKPERMERTRIRSATRVKYPLEGHTCIFCPNPAEERHHTTEPPEVDKFLFLCNGCHLGVHGKVPRNVKIRVSLGDLKNVN